MNFGSLLYVAQSNAETQKNNEVRCYKTTFAPAKKETPKHRTLSANVQKFLAKQEEEKRIRDIEAQKKKEELLKLRSQDKLAYKRVGSMLKRTKSANKSVMEDAVDAVNTVVTINGPYQPDEDDYGYQSQEANSFYAKLMDKYSSMPPEEDKFAKPKKTVIQDLSAAKERVKATLHRIEEEELLPRKRKRKSKENKEVEEDNFIDDVIRYREKDEEPEETKKPEEEPKEIKPKKPKRPAPPPMDFSQLLKIAEQKQYEPIVIEKKKPVDDEDEKPMTKKQRLEYLREKEARIQKERRMLEDEERTKSLSRTKRKSSSDEDEGSRTSQPRSLAQIPKIPKLNQSNESKSSSNSKSASDSTSSNKLQSIKIPKLSDKTQKANSSKLLPPSVAEEMLKKSANVWSKPCNLSPAHSPSRKPNLSSNSHRDDKHRNDKYSKNSSSHQNHDHRKDSDKSSSVNRSSSDLDRRKNSLTALDKNKLLEEIERKRLAMKEKLMNDRNGVMEKKVDKNRDEKSKKSDSDNNKSDSFSSTSRSSSSNRNEINKSSSSSKFQDHQKSRNNGDLSNRSKINSVSSSDKPRINYSGHRSRINGEANSKSRSNGEIRNKSRTDGESSQKSKINGDINKPKSNSEVFQRSKSNGEISERSRAEVGKKSSINDSNKKQPVKKIAKVLVDLFGDEFPDNKGIQKNGSLSRALENSAVKSTSQPSSKDRNDVKSNKPISNGTDSKSISMEIKRPVNDRKEMNNNNKIPPSGMKPSEVKSRQFPPADVRPRQFPPPDVRSRQFPPPDVRSRQFPPSDMRRSNKPPPPPRRHEYNGYHDNGDEDSEYDSEMDDFIDDGEDGDEVDVSGCISQIFGYDRKRYKNIDDDDIEEANFAQMMKEEVRSTKIGMQEDLEEYLRDKEEKKRAQQRKLQKLAEMRKKKKW